jgi:hypothetical protein
MKSELEKRLTRQLAAQGQKDAEGLAHGLLLGCRTRSSWSCRARQRQGIALRRASASPARIRVRSEDEHGEAEEVTRLEWAYAAQA